MSYLIVAGTKFIFAYLMNKKIIKAVMMKSISVETTFPYSIHLYDSCSIFFTFNFVNTGFRSRGVIKSSINHLTNSQALLAMSSQIAIPTTLYWLKKFKNS